MTDSVLRTPASRFVGLDGYDFEPRWHTTGDLRLHYLDEGPAGRPVVLFHGEPTWSYLYRKIIPALTGAGYRAIAPDYPGFGRSDKPTNPDFYTYDAHVAAMESLLGGLGLRHATAVVQDWGGPIGLRLAVDHPEWFDRLVIMNTGLFGGKGAPSPGFQAWRAFVERTPDLPIGLVMSRAAVQEWPAQVLEAYEAPFPDVHHKVGAHRFPLIVPLADTDEGAAEMRRVRERLSEWTNPTLVLFSTEDPVFSPRVGERFAARIPGAGPVELVEGAGHFLQEDQGEEVAARVVDFLQRTDGDS